MYFNVQMFDLSNLTHWGLLNLLREVYFSFKCNCFYFLSPFQYSTILRIICLRVLMGESTSLDLIDNISILWTMPFICFLLKSVIYLSFTTSFLRQSRWRTSFWIWKRSLKHEEMWLDHRLYRNSLAI